jgi:hypothetical protein
MVTAHDSAAEAEPKTTMRQVPEVFHLGAPGLGQRLAQDGEVSPPELVGGVGRQALREFGRTHYVGEQDRHVFDGQEIPSRQGVP